ncbi:MAG: Glucose-1-phosphate thymidylyltransferase [Chlamydiia bacterium]|nr:Glucose-1-phosphate thymidylyltransferase [Chlamydiia bacterium]
MNKKGIILAGGLGTRLYPLTKIVSKQLLPVYDKPMIYYPLSTLMQLQIRDIMIIATDLDIKRFKTLLGDGSLFGINITYAIQNSPEGIPQSFLLGEEFIQNDPVVLILGDNIFYSKNYGNFFNRNIKTKGATVFAKTVENPTKYGVIEKDHFGNLSQIVEKPTNPPTNLAVTGLYFYDNQVVDITKELKRSDRGEYEITDINNTYLKKGELHVKTFDESVTWFDTGSFDSLFDAAYFVKSEQTKDVLVGSVEFVAYQNGWISDEELEKLAQKYIKSGYGEKIVSLLGVGRT